MGGNFYIIESLRLATPSLCSTELRRAGAPIRQAHGKQESFSLPVKLRPTGEPTFLRVLFTLNLLKGGSFS